MSTMPSGSSSSSMSGFQSAISQAVREHWKLFLVEGIILVILGILAIIIPPLATIGITIFIGWLFLISGIACLITTFGARQAPGFWWSLLSAVLGIAAGIVLLGWPVSGAVSLTLLLIVFLMIEGISKVIFALTIRPFPNWGWVLASGIIGILLALYLWASLPITAIWLLGVLLGIQLICEGAALGYLAWQVRQS